MAKPATEPESLVSPEEGVHNLWVPISWGLHKIFTPSVSACIFSQYHPTGVCKKIT